MDVKSIFQEHPNHAYLLIDLKYIVDLGLENLISKTITMLSWKKIAMLRYL